MPTAAAFAISASARSTEKSVEYAHIDKAYDDGERTVIITSDDLASLPAEKSREIDVLEFVPSDQIDPIRFDRSYYLEPDSKSSKAYVLLRRTLEETDRTAIVQFALRQKSRLAALRVTGDVLVLQTLLWDDEVRDAKFSSLNDKPTVSAKELEMSARLVDSYSADFEPSKFTDGISGAAASAHRCQARGRRRGRHRRDVRRGGEERRRLGRRGARPHGGSAAERREEPGEGR